MKEEFVMKDTFDRKIGKIGICFRGEIYTFEGYEKYLGALATFFVQEDYLVVSLEGEVFHARRQDI